ncbi:DNA cytosine methyltransferase [Brevundimonas sp. NIBR11]|uniref:DNA cytosine methyltransferase n=1 Tax=Brevundimonas sp. NIBR11 TaxID=3015999 RepID=UPI0022F0040D|nr:DNA cytosine methyltransferase [Brevundimonas sp. NIBR11]WGM31220.1 Modification methylase HhaI [Brevundimonas sp. NIBR11]
MPGFYEFFAGGGMVRAGLGAGWDCLFANDFDARKGLTYQANWGTGGELTVGDIRALSADALPDRPDLVWGSFPCQDLSLAGHGKGLAGERSGTFYAFWDLVTGLAAEGRAPRLVAVENVCGALTSRNGQDFEAMARTFAEAGYRFGALVINADLFTPQSRPRLFVVGLHADTELSEGLTSPEPLAPFHTPAVIRAVDRLPADLRAKALWWNLPTPPHRTQVFADLIEEAPDSIAWHTPAETDRLLSMMSPVNRAKVQAAQRAGRRMVGGVYRRTRTEASGNKVQRAEVRFDDVAGCLRTPSGGSSRQTILVIDGPRIRSRLISARETARLMGLPESYILPRRYSDAYHLTGDGVVVPVARHLAHHLLEPLIGAPQAKAQAA